MRVSRRDVDLRLQSRSRGGLTAKIHALVDADRLPIALEFTDGRGAKEMLDQVRAGQILLADRVGAHPRAGEAGPRGESDALRQSL